MEKETKTADELKDMMRRELDVPADGVSFDVIPDATSGWTIDVSGVSSNVADASGRLLDIAERLRAEYDLKL